MANAVTLTLLLLLLPLVCATYAAAAAPAPAPGPAQGNPSAALDAACKKTPDPGYCEMLLQPYAAQFAGNDSKKMGFAAMKATLGQVQATKTFMIREAFKNNTSKAVRDAAMVCVGMIARGESNLKMAVRELNYTRYTRDAAADMEVQRKRHRVDPKKMVDGATTELAGCLDGLKKIGESGKAAGGGDGEETAIITQAALRKTNESLLACSVANAFIPKIIFF